MQKGCLALHQILPTNPSAYPDADDIRYPEHRIGWRLEGRGGCMSAEEVIGMSLAELTSAYASRALSPVEVLLAVMDHSGAVNGAINALFSIRPGEAMEHARQSEARWKADAALGPLDGAPMTVKDTVAMAGWPYFHGIAASRPQPPSDYDWPPAIPPPATVAAILAKAT